ncbi:MAG: ACP S-malonyltransferase [Gammaproteobacteria bacterium]|nr:ACP S-malonyltransferase [Gammaproteobacteria bacterium]
MSQSLAFVFPGQGSQFVGMLADIAREFPEVEATFSEASKVLGYDLWNLVQNGPAEALDQTVQTQPALLAASYAIWRILKTKKNIAPALLAGHSLGEYTALVCANAISFKDAIALVAARGQYMQEAVPVGVSGLGAIVGLDDATVQALCDQSRQADEVLSPANFNSPGQVVIAGHIKAVERALVLAKESGARLAKLLPVSVSSHCELMKPAAEKLAALLATIAIQTPTIPVVSNVDVTMYADAAAIRDGLVRQLYMPVRWVETIQLFAQKGITHIVECGPGKVLSGLNKRIVTDRQLTSTADIASLQTLLETSFETQG